MNERFIKEWTDNQLEQAKKAFLKWECNNLTITYGIRKAKVTDTYGLPYTSSSKCAMVSNTNVTAVLKENNKYRFSYIAITDSGKIVAVCEDMDENEIHISIGTVKAIIYILFSCNEWKEHSSMRLIMATTNKDLLNGQICTEIMEGNMAFGGIMGTDGVTSFIEADQALSCVDYGYVHIIEDGEVL